VLKGPFRAETPHAPIIRVRCQPAEWFTEHASSPASKLRGFSLHALDGGLLSSVFVRPMIGRGEVSVLRGPFRAETPHAPIIRVGCQSVVFLAFVRAILDKAWSTPKGQRTGSEP
jgi:hypothetical protein